MPESKELVINTTPPLISLIARDDVMREMENLIANKTQGNAGV
jgi:hypothetical protein